VSIKGCERSFMYALRCQLTRGCSLAWKIQCMALRFERYTIWTLYDSNALRFERFTIRTLSVHQL